MSKLDYAQPTLRREIGLFGAVMLGLGSILGTGVFVSLAHATELAGPWVLLAILLAGLLAYCNAMSSAQLAAAYPVSGGTYEYGYRVLNPTLGFTAGWMFLLAKSASAATAALGCRDVIARSAQVAVESVRWSMPQHVWIELEQWSFQSRGLSALAFAAVIASTLFILSGLKRTLTLNGFFVLVTLSGLGCFVFVVLSAIATLPLLSGSAWPVQFGAIGFPVLAEVTALMFVAFTGYGRLATLGEEVKRPRTNIPISITITLLFAISLYLVVGYCLHGTLFKLGGTSLSGSHNNLVTQAHYLTFYRSDGSLLFATISLAAVTAMLGVLLNLILGLSRVWLAMGRRGDMPRILARVNEKTSTPVPATILSGAVIALLVLVGDVRTTWSFSAFTVLIYYAITNLACLRLAPEHRRYPRFLAWVGLFACLSLAWFVEMKVWIAGTVLIGVGLIWHRLTHKSRQGAAASSTPRADLH